MQVLERHYSRFIRAYQRGVVLIVALVVLLVLSLLGISGMQNTVLEERMAGNMYDRNLAFQAAEAALRAGELAVLAGTTVSYDVAGINAPTDLGDDANWPTTAIKHTTSLAGLSAAPEYIFETQHALPPLEADQPLSAPLVKVSSRGTGRNGTSVVVLQSILKP